MPPRLSLVIPATVARRMIGAARNGGAALATAPMVGFCDADMQIHPGPVAR